MMVKEIKEYFQKVSDAIFDCTVMSSTYEEAEKYNGSDLASIRTIEGLIASIEDAIILNEKHTGIAIEGLLPDITAIREEFKPYSAQIDFAGIIGDKDTFTYLRQVNRNFETFVSLLKERCSAHNIMLPEIPQEPEYISESQQIKLPNELNNDKARGIFEKAIKKGVINIDASGYHWNRAKNLLAYFGEQMNSFLNISTGEYNGAKKNSWKSYEILFNNKNLARAKRDYAKYESKPTGYKEIDSLFK